MVWKITGIHDMGTLWRTKMSYLSILIKKIKVHLGPCRILIIVIKGPVDGEKSKLWTILKKLKFFASLGPICTKRTRHVTKGPKNVAKRPACSIRTSPPTFGCIRTNFSRKRTDRYIYLSIYLSININNYLNQSTPWCTVDLCIIFRLVL